MNSRYLLSAIMQIIFLLFYIEVAVAQVVVEKSKEKVVIAGRQYYIHTVKKGETAYSISKVYGITVEELIRENPPAVYGIKDGQLLQIPVVESGPDQSSNVPVSIRVNKDESRFIYHKLNAGETVYFLSRKYGVSENEILTSNPGVDINKISIGTEIAIPRRGFMIEKQKFDNQGLTYSYHKVVRGESLSDIASKYGISVRELRRANRGLIFPKVNDYVRIPGKVLIEKVQSDSLIADTSEIVIDTLPIIYKKPDGMTPVNNLNDTFDVALLLPLYLADNAKRTLIDSSGYLKGKRIYKVRQIGEEWLYPRSIPFVEMYEGILLAVDTLCSLGLNVNLHVWDIKSDTVALTRLIASGKLNYMDLIIGPVYSNNLAIIAPFANKYSIPVVSPVPLINNKLLENNPFVFMAHPSVEAAQESLAKKISEYYDHNLVLIHSDTSGYDPDIARFKSKIFEELNYKMPYESIRFKEMIFYSRSKFNNDSINRLAHSLSHTIKNLVIIASDDDPVMSETITEVHNLSRKFDVKVLGYPEMRSIKNLDHRYYFDLGILLYTPYWINYSKNDIKRFNSNYLNKFLTQPREQSYAWQGYDIAYYFLSGLAIHGKLFLTYPQIHNPDLLETEFDFQRKSPADGFENKKLFLIQYTNNMEIELVNDQGNVNTYR